MITRLNVKVILTQYKCGDSDLESATDDIFLMFDDVAHGIPFEQDEDEDLYQHMKEKLTEEGFNER